MTYEVHLGDIGSVFQTTLKDRSGAIIPLEEATVKQIIFHKPDSSIVTQSAEFLTDGSDGIIRYISVLGDMDTVGDWEVQAYVETPSGKWHTDTDYFRVIPNLS